MILVFISCKKYKNFIKNIKIYLVFYKKHSKIFIGRKGPNLKERRRLK